LLAEVKNQRGKSNEWAAQFRRNMLAHGTLPPSPFFLIATPDHMHFWNQADSDLAELAPQFTMDATSELRPYFEKLGQTPGRLGGPAFEMVVFAWLNDLAESGQARASEDPSLRWLSESGLLEALGRAHISLGAVQ